jgi:photosystem II stability/assembly factor-like uncharacterized protein
MFPRCLTVHGDALAAMICPALLWFATPGCAGGQGAMSDAPPDGPGSASNDSGESIGWVDESDLVGDSTVETVRFVDGLRGFMTASDGDGHGLYRTSDGGHTWAQADVDSRPIGVGFSPALDELWLVGNGPAFRSSDGGGSFGRLDTLPSDFYAQAYLWDAQTGIVTSEVGDRVHRTTDRGATWSTFTFGRDAFPGTNRMAVLADQVWLVGGPLSAPDGKGAHVAHSTDRAVSWSVTTLQDNAHGGTGGSLLGAFAVSPDDVWVVGANRQMFHTIDRGISWNQIAGLPPEVLHLCAVLVQGRVVTVAASLKDPTEGYAILESTDGGATFAVTTTLRAPRAWDALGVHGMTALPGGGYLIYGYAGLLYRKLP